MIHNLLRLDRGGVYVGVKPRAIRIKILLKAKILDNALDWIKRLPLKSTFKQLFLELRSLLIPIMSGNAKSPAKGLKDLEYERGAIANRPPIPYLAPVDPYEKQDKIKIKVKLSDGTNYQIVPFCTGSNEDYVNHIIEMIRLVQQKELESSVEKVFVVVSDIKDKIGPLHKKLNMSKSREEKESLTQQIETAEKELEKAKKKALTEIVKAH